VPRVITRAERLVNERIFEKVGVDVVLSAKGTAIRRVVSDLIQSDSRHIDELEHGDFQVLDIELPEHFTPLRLQDLDLPRFAIIGAIFRGRSVQIPRGKHMLEPRDHLLVICHHAKEADLFDALGLTGPDDA
jgi:trk system potassium uptake protein TrkA